MSDFSSDIRRVQERMNNLSISAHPDFVVAGHYSTGFSVENKRAAAAIGGGPLPPPVPITIQNPIGVAASNGGLLLVTMYLTNDIAYVNCDGSSFVFCTLPDPPVTSGEEHYITIAPSGIYATRGDSTGGGGPATIYLCSLGSVSPFASIPGATADHIGITFDTTSGALFGGNLIATDITGKVWTIDIGGTVTLLGNISRYIEGPAVAPASFGTYANQVLVADENLGQIHAIDSSGTVTHDVFDWSGAESVAAIPDAGFGTRCSGDAYYVACENLNLVQNYPSSSFAGLTGVMIDSEFGGGIANVSWNGSSYDINFFDIGPPGALMEGTCFVVS